MMVLLIFGALCSAGGALGSLAIMRLRPLTANERCDLNIHFICAVCFLLIAFLEYHGV